MTRRLEIGLAYVFDVAARLGVLLLLSWLVAVLSPLDLGDFILETLFIGALGAWFHHYRLQQDYYDRAQRYGRRVVKLEQEQALLVHTIKVHTGKVHR